MRAESGVILGIMVARINIDSETKMTSHQDPKQRRFVDDLDARVLTAQQLLLADGNQAAASVLREGTAAIADIEHDNWNGGTDIYSIAITIPVPLFASLKSRMAAIEKAIADSLRAIIRAEHDGIGSVSIVPELVRDRVATGAVILARGTDGTYKSTVPKQEPPPLTSMWNPGEFRLFISHVHIHKKVATAIKTELREYGIDAFVAHEDIEPHHEWQLTIEAALRTMDALVALITPEFHESKWTDQEIGWALGRQVPVFMVRCGADPYGFVAKRQALQEFQRKGAEIASDLLDVLTQEQTIGLKVVEALTATMEKSKSYRQLNDVMKRISEAAFLSEDVIRRLLATIEQNHYVATAHVLPKRIKDLCDVAQSASGDVRK